MPDEARPEAPSETSQTALRAVPGASYLLAVFLAAVAVALGFAFSPVGTAGKAVAALALAALIARALRRIVLWARGPRTVS
jgi:hypothetical protein